MSETYTDRHEEIVTIDRKEEGANGGATLHFTNGWSCFAPPEVAARVGIGSDIVQETRGLSLITGWREEQGWIIHKSDEDLERERQEMIARHEQERADNLERNRADWQARQDALPKWAQDRLLHFHEKAGETFAREGWGYELVVCELAALYADSEGDDTEEIDTYADREGTSGNQHDFAKALASAHRRGVALAGTVSALSPITGDADYSEATR